jgi:hypothetical protein
MTLTVGTTLQNGKYVIQATSEQNDFGVTYTATQVYLDQTVLLQTLSAVPTDSAKAIKLQEQFLEGVRCLTTRRHAYSGKVLDYFVEGNAPFVVLEKIDGKLPPSVKDWLPGLAPPAVKTELGEPEPVDAPRPAESRPAESTAAPSPEANSQTPVPPSVPLQPALNAVDAELEADVATAAIAHHIAHHNGSTSLNPSPPIAPTVGVTQAVAGGRSPQRSVNVLTQAKRKSNPWLPVSLVMTSVIAGVVGASFGWAVRFDNLGSTGSKSIPLLSNEQSFPSLENWPIQESPDLAPSEPVWERSTRDRPIRDTPIDYAPIPSEPQQDEKALRGDDFLPELAPIPDGTDPLTPDAPPLNDAPPDVPESSSNPDPGAGAGTAPPEPSFLPDPVAEPSTVAPAPAPDTSSVKPLDVTPQ